MSCLTCKHWEPRKSAAMANSGFAACAMGRSYEFLPLRYSCERESALPDGLKEKRVTWAQRKVFKIPA